MKLSSQAQNILDQFKNGEPQLGQLRKIAKEIKKDHDLALELWSSGSLHARLLAILIMDKKMLDQKSIDQLDRDIQSHNYEERNQLMDWLLANQVTKDKKTLALLTSWEHSPSKMQRRLFWYHQARLRWVGQTPPDNTEALLSSIESRMTKEEPEVQWAMNFTAGQIGVFDPSQRKRCIQIGEKTGLFKDEDVPKGCTPSYLPLFINIQVDKLKK